MWTFGLLLSLTPGARAASNVTVDTTVLLGARTAPESAILVPESWEGTFDPSALGAVDVRARLDGARDGWARLSAGAWGYAPDFDASEVHGGAGAGWSGAAGKATTVDLAARYDGAWLPLIPEASTGRAEAMLRARILAEPVGVTPQLLLVDRRVLGAPAANFSTGEAGFVAEYNPSDTVGLDAGLSGQTNEAGGLGGEGPWGAQLRTFARVRLSGTAWRLALEHRYIWALDGETETDTEAVFTLAGDYAADVDALSGGGYTQHRIDLAGAVNTGRWTFSAGGLVRLRSASEEELAAAYGQSFGGQARVERGIHQGLSAFVSAGVSTAASPNRAGYTDVRGWTGLTWQATPRAETSATQ